LKNSAEPASIVFQQPAKNFSSRFLVIFHKRCFIMKSSYELAMERLAKSAPAAKPLTPAQKARLGEIDRLYQGKLAEREIFLKKQLDDALAAGQADEYEKIKMQLVHERARIEEEREEEKERVRHERA
jgi:hypothetical protein